MTAVACAPVNLLPTCVTAITATRGDSIGLVLHVWTDAAHTVPADLSTALVTADLKVKPTDVDPVDSWNIDIAGGDITLTLTPAQCRTLPLKTVWDCQVDWFSDDATVTTVASGTLALTQDVTSP